jgi:hypothetical protein
MLHGEKVILRAIERDDLERIWAFNNDLAVELAGAGDPPYPQSLARLRQHVWNNGAYVDEVVMGVLREEWSARK